MASRPRKRVHKRREGLIDGFTSRYGVTRFVHFECHASMIAAIIREKRIRTWRRDWKPDLIEAGDPR